MNWQKKFFIIYKKWVAQLLIREKKERLREQAKDEYKNLSKEEKNKKREYGKNRYHSISEEKKQKLKEYQKGYREVKKHHYNNE